MLLSKLIESAASIGQEMGYAPRALGYSVLTWKQFAAFCAEKETGNYSSDLRDDYLRFLVEQEKAAIIKPATRKRKTAAMTQLDAFARNGSWEKGRQIQHDPLPEEFLLFLSKYDAALVKKAYSEFSRKTIQEYCSGFMRFLIAHEVETLSKLTREHVSKYLLTLNGHAKSTVRCELSRLRQILRFMYLLEYTTEDFSVLVPSYHFGQSDSLVKIWDSDEILRVLDTVDKSSAKGKRDRVFIMIAAELGVRSTDIRNLKLTDIDWERCSISFVQHKTRKPNVLPLSENLGSAIIDYLKMRPETDSPYLFINLIPPYGQMIKFNTSFMKYVDRSGVKVECNAHHGLHSLRATVATRLLNADVSPDVIVPFLGHSGPESLHSYIRFDIEHLRECALSFEGGALI